MVIIDDETKTRLETKSAGMHAGTEFENSVQAAKTIARWISDNSSVLTGTVEVPLEVLEASDDDLKRIADEYVERIGCVEVADDDDVRDVLMFWFSCAEDLNRVVGVARHLHLAINVGMRSA